METEGPHAVVYAEWLEAPDQPTVLIYGCECMPAGTPIRHPLLMY